MGLEKVTANLGKEIIAWTKATNKSLPKPVRINTNSLKLDDSLVSDIVNIGKNNETCKVEIYHKVKCWNPIDKNLGFPGVYEIPEDYIGKGHIYIDKLVTGKEQSRGTGTRTIQKIVRESLADPDCQGRIRGEVMPIDISRGSSLGFCYKLGFRAERPDINEKCAKWLAEGGEKSKVPFTLGVYMYLPKENIEHCLNYKV